MSQHFSTIQVTHTNYSDYNSVHCFLPLQLYSSHYFILYKNFTKYDVYLNVCTVIGIGLTDFTEKGSDVIIWSKTN